MIIKFKVIIMTELLSNNSKLILFLMPFSEKHFLDREMDVFPYYF